MRTAEFDADDLASHGPLVERLICEYGRIDTAVLAFGILGEQDRAETDPAHAVAIVHTDYLAQISLLTVLAMAMRGAGAGTLVVFSSVAGVRVRRANYVYGSAKAGLDGFASGLSDALHGSGVRLLLVRPGFVIGRMTQGWTPRRCPALRRRSPTRRRGRCPAAGARYWVPWALRPLFAGMRLLPQAVWRGFPDDRGGGDRRRRHVRSGPGVAARTSPRGGDLRFTAPTSPARRHRRGSRGGAGPARCCPRCSTCWTTSRKPTCTSWPAATRWCTESVRLWCACTESTGCGCCRTSSVSLARARMGWSAEGTEVISLVTALVHTAVAPRRQAVVLCRDADTPRRWPSS